MSQPAIFQEHLLLPHTRLGAVWPFSRPDQKPSHFHGQLEFLLVLRGRAVERIGNTEYTVHPGQLIWHLPGVEHEMIYASSDLDLRVVQAEPDLLATTRSGLGNDAAASEGFTRWVRELGWLAAGRPVIELRRADRDALLEDCYTTSVEAPSLGNGFDRLHRAFSKACHATRSDVDDRRANSLVELACCLLLERPGLSRSQVCRELDVSEGYLSRRFREELALSFAEQRSRLRLVRFATHVMRDRQNFLEAALSSGFGSYSQLHRVFVQLVGMSPREYLFRGGRNLRGLVSCSQTPEAKAR